MTIQAVVFDMDDTLYSEYEYVLSGYKAVHTWIEQRRGITNFYAEAVNVMRSGEKRYVFNKTLERLGVDYDDIFIKDMIDHYRSHKPQIHLFDDAEWVLQQLDTTVKIGLISDGFYVAQENKVQALGLRKRIDSIILTDQWGKDNWKPSERPYHQVSKDLGIPHHSCVYIGDNVSKDFVTAKKIGWTTVHINRKYGVYSNLELPQKYQAHFRIENLKELSNIEVLRHLFNR
ncbi:HAD family hydrolase [Ammoniphilus sp. YIM 78166]|uniref:HAD family hydrolase n=1 Tax=Ammoniphilus sp. YIM 78166 TaxID=1644106 RepID=UPI00106F7BFB|nr:HAD family hydrolase [Ammoniphilus sp. YIM 78166]